MNDDFAIWFLLLSGIAIGIFAGVVGFSIVKGIGCNRDGYYAWDSDNGCYNQTIIKNFESGEVQESTQSYAN